jgi:acetyl esterase/lipase
MKMKIIFILYLGLQSIEFGMQNNQTFLVPDTIIYQAFEGEVNFEDKVFGFPLWENGVPDNIITHPQERILDNHGSDHNEFELNRVINYIETPNVLVIPTESTGPNPAVVILPGGAFQGTFLDKEGIDIAQHLRKYGITGVVVNYRTLPETFWNTNIPYDVINAIYDDVKRSIRVIRERANEFNIDPDKIGVMGFSAGGLLAAWLVSDTFYTQSSLNDATDAVSCRPDFSGLVYPAIENWIIQQITPDAAPSFLVSTEDDVWAPTVYVQQLYDALLTHSVEAEFALFQTGGHGYGLGIHGGDVAQWPAMFVNWLYSIGVVTNPTSIENTETEFPIEFVLLQNYPNPFNPATTIRYSLPQEGKVSLEIYNLLGQKLETLVDEYQPAGEHMLQWQSKYFPSGIYFMRLQTGTQVKTMKLVLQK